MMQLILPDEVGGSPEWVTYQVHGLWQVHSFCYFPPQEMRGVRAGEMGSSRVCWHEDVSSDPKDLGKTWPVQSSWTLVTRETINKRIPEACWPVRPASSVSSRFTDSVSTNRVGRLERWFSSEEHLLLVQSSFDPSTHIQVTSQLSLTPVLGNLTLSLGIPTHVTSTQTDTGVHVNKNKELK